MSSWERARRIPWTHIPTDGSNLGDQKERIHRQLQREATQQENSQQQEPLAEGEAALSIKKPFAGMDLFKHAAMGGCIGSITGLVFGFLDGMRAAGESQVLKNASNMAKGKYLMQGATRSATVFGVFFSGFHVIKYGVKVTADPGEWAEIGLAGAVSMAGLAYKPAFRASMPYASMLIIMDSFHVVMREFND
jgi:hypothetical protein